MKYISPWMELLAHVRMCALKDDKPDVTFQINNYAKKLLSGVEFMAMIFYWIILF